MFHLRDIYTSWNEFRLYDALHHISTTLGFESAEETWAANPLLGEVLEGSEENDTP